MRSRLLRSIGTFVKKVRQRRARRSEWTKAWRDPNVSHLEAFWLMQATSRASEVPESFDHLIARNFLTHRDAEGTLRTACAIDSGPTARRVLFLLRVFCADRVASFLGGPTLDEERVGAIINELEATHGTAV